MSGRLLKHSYEKLIKEDLAWISNMPPSLEKSHIMNIVADSTDMYYPPSGEKLSSSEALYGFMGWLTSRPEVLTLSGANDSAPVVDLIVAFCEANNLDMPSEDWAGKNLQHPREAKG